MSRYRLDFIEGLGGPLLTPPPRRVRFGTTRDLRDARIERRHRVYLVLLTEAGIRYVIQANGHVRVDADAGDMAGVADMWNYAEFLVCSGRDLQ